MIIALEENLFEHGHLGMRLKHLRFQKRMTLVGRVLFGGCIGVSFLASTSWEQTVMLFASVLGGGYAFILADLITDEMLKLARAQKLGKGLSTHSGVVTLATLERAKADMNDYEGVYIYFDYEKEKATVGIPRLEDWVHFRLKYL